MSAPAGLDDAPHGVSLARYAAVTAAVAEPFGRARVLALEELDPRAFLAAEIVWKKRIARRGGPALARYREELAAAEDWLVRRVTPLHQDAKAWAAFLAMMAVKPAEILRATGLGKNDFSRLSRHWARLAQEDSGIAGDIASHLADGITELPAITVEPRQLRRSRAFQARAKPVAALPVRKDRAAPPPVVEIDPGSVVPHAPPVVAAAPLLIKPVPAYEEPATLALPSAIAAPAPLPFTKKPVEEGPTQSVPAISKAAVLPFVARAESASAQPSSERVSRTVPVNEGAADSEHGTEPLPAVVVPRAALPFSEKVQEEHGTQALPAVKVLAQALPFAGRPTSTQAPQSVPVSTRDVTPPTAPASRRELPLRVEQYASLCVEVSQRPDLAADTARRYGLSAEAKAALDAQYAERFRQDPALYRAFQHAAATYRAWLASTQTQREAASGPRSEVPARAPSGPASAAAASRFTLEQYASLIVDLSRDPARRAETLTRYGLTEAQRAALDDVWRARFAAEPAVRPAFDRACAVYRAMLASGAR